MRLARVVVSLTLAGCSSVMAAEIAPSRVQTTPGPTMGRYSDRTVSVALSVDRDMVRLIGYTVKNRPFLRPFDADKTDALRGAGESGFVVALVGPNGDTYTQRLPAPWICFSHDPSSPPHVMGDTIVLHRDATLIELPEMAGFDQVELSREELTDSGLKTARIGNVRLDRSGFTAAGGSAAYEGLAFADPDDKGQPAPLTTGAVLWPESFGDNTIYKVEGSLAEATRRINVTVVPDGYTYADKDLMTAHFNDMVGTFRQTTPYEEHDPFINYTLVYAYSVESGTDQCDCGVIRDTAMGTGFNPAGDPCGGSANRCLYYGSSCDNSTLANIVAAEMRAPVHDTTIIMVNTARYGGCGGQRSVYAAGHASGSLIALHELGHSLAGLADEYESYPGCGGFAGGINTSTDPASGAWPEWIPDLGAPRQGGQYYPLCIYRPFDGCAMRSLGQPFCAVCNQRWALTLLGHHRVDPTAPIESSYPPSAPSACQGKPATYSVDTRLPAASAGNQISWTLSGPGFPSPTLVASGVSSHTRTFTEPGSYTLVSDVIADTGFIKPSRYGANRQTVTWSIGVYGPTGDADGDGCGSAGDCNNANAAVYPGAAQVCDGLNNDCNAPGWPATNGTNDGDADGDALSQCQGDCDDALASVRPGAPQVCDGVNNDCNDPAWPSLPSAEQDVDHDDWRPCQGDCDDTRGSVRPFGTQICGDGLNNDCNDPSWPDSAASERDDDGDAISECQGDCDDTRISVRPFGTQICGDGLNNDCVAPGWPSLAGTNEADDDSDGFQICAGDCDDGNMQTHPGAVEVNDQEDNQCAGEPGHGVVDEISGDAGFPDRNDTTRFCWQLQSGASRYRVLRSASAVFNACDVYTVGLVDCLADGGQPPAGGLFFYLVRADAPFPGSWGQTSAGVERTSGCLPVCGNGVRESFEVCDGADLAGETCVSQGYDSGTLACDQTCGGFDYSRCRL